MDEDADYLSARMDRLEDKLDTLHTLLSRLDVVVDRQAQLSARLADFERNCATCTAQVATNANNIKHAERGLWALFTVLVAFGEDIVKWLKDSA